MLTFTLVLFGIAAVLTIVGVFLWPSRHDFISGLLMVGGVITCLYVVPWMVNTYELAAEPGWIGTYGRVLNFVDYFAWIPLLIIGLLCLLDAGAAGSRHYTVSPTGIPSRVAAPAAATAGTTTTTTPAGVFQFQAACLLFIAGVTFITLGINAARKTYIASQRPLVNKEFVDFQSKITSEGFEGIEVKLFPAKPDIQIIFTGSFLEEDEDEQQRWKDLLESTFKADQGETLVVEKVTTVIGRSFDGKIVKEFVVVFNGKIDKTDPKPDKVVTGQGYPIPSNLNEDETRAWIEGWNNKILSVFTTPSTPTPVPSSTTTAATTPVPTGIKVQPPKPGPFIKVN